MTEEDEEDFKNNDACRFCVRNIENGKVKDHCHLTGKYRGPAYSRCNINITQNQSNFIPFLFLNFNYDSHMFFRKLVDKEMIK